MDIRMKLTDGPTRTGKSNRFSHAKGGVFTVCKDADINEAARNAGACGFIATNSLLELRQLLTNRTGRKMPVLGCEMLT